MEAKVKAQQISIHALREEGDLSPVTGSKRVRNFYPRPPRGGRRCGLYRAQVNSEISIHALREEGDPGCKMAAASSWAFLSTPSARRATMKWDGSNNDYKFLSTPSARRATSSRDFLYSSMSISIHALREEGDLAAICSTAPRFTISIHAEEGDRVAGFFFCHSANFYPRPPRGGRPVFRLLWLYHSIFLSTPSARRATRNYVAPRLTELFLSTPSARRATFFDCQQDEVIRISIHALREEGDRAADTYRRQYHDFYPRPPRGGRPLADEQIAAINEFLSTPSARRATFVCHLLILLCIFLSTPSARRATRQQHLHRDDRAISIHALREEGDGCGLDWNVSIYQFLSTPSARRATLWPGPGN